MTSLGANYRVRAGHGALRCPAFSQNLRAAGGKAVLFMSQIRTSTATVWAPGWAGSKASAPLPRVPWGLCSGCLVGLDSSVGRRAGHPGELRECAGCGCGGAHLIGLEAGPSPGAGDPQTGLNPEG